MMHSMTNAKMTRLDPLADYLKAALR